MSGHRNTPKTFSFRQNIIQCLCLLCTVRVVRRQPISVPISEKWKPSLQNQREEKRLLSPNQLNGINSFIFSIFIRDRCLL